MKLFKQADFYGQMLLLVGFTMATLINGFGIMMIGYFVVGTWQFTSMVVHFYNEWHIRKSGMRYIYFYVSVVAIVLLAISFLFPQALFPLLFIMLFLSPFMACFYLFICYNEVFNPYKRPSETIF